MPQTVPSAGFTPPCDYSAFADSFDLSLLPSYESNDAELPAYPPVSYYTPSPPSMFPGGAEDLFGKSSVKSPPQIFTSFYPNSPIDSKEDLHNSLCQSPYGSPYQQQQLNYNKDDTHQYLVPFFPVSPSTSSNTSYSNRSSPIYPQSVSPVYPIKNENTIDLNEILEESQFLQKTISGNNQQPLFPLSPQQFPQKGPDVQEPIKEPKSENNYQLLREVLRDTSFQKKYNLRPFEFGNIGTGFVGCIKMEEQKIKMEPDDGQKEEEKRRDEALMSSCNEELTRQKIEPVLNMAIQQMRKDVDNTCLTLGISTDPNQWSTEDVKAWLLWTLQQFGLGPIQMEYFNMDGSMFACLSEEDFSQRAPQSGSILHAQLEIWKAARMEAELGGNGATASTSGGGETSVGAVGWNKAQTGSNQSSNASSGDVSEDDDEELPAPAKVAAPSTSTSTTTATGKAPSSRGAGSTGSSHIHLWQFLKELLASPSLYGSAIRWIDRSKGVFKIEDSVRVARLWGKRKNRPAMNYDKLSRSIRQYYKKGIMKKTERSQRLVYQFCHPYCL